MRKRDNAASRLWRPIWCVIKCTLVAGFVGAILLCANSFRSGVLAGRKSATGSAIIVAASRGEMLLEYTSGLERPSMDTIPLGFFAKRIGMLPLSEAWQGRLAMFTPEDELGSGRIGFPPRFPFRTRFARWGLIWQTSWISTVPTWYHPPDAMVDSQTVIIPLWMIVAVFAFPSTGLLWRRLARLRYPPEGHCPGCGYDLKASPLRCPECGRPATVTAGGKAPSSARGEPTRN